ncbi:hypothetical protein M0R45_015788 [Rubus argutus]|uniref:Uncharacterized protein n=1 Tax=Rubus argutus TaxID=59490 RepID=A0AAW1XRM8_RUBAR
MAEINYPNSTTNFTTRVVFTSHPLPIYKPLPINHINHSTSPARGIPHPLPSLIPAEPRPKLSSLCHRTIISFPLSLSGKEKKKSCQHRSRGRFPCCTVHCRRRRTSPALPSSPCRDPKLTTINPRRRRSSTQAVPRAAPASSPCSIPSQPLAEPSQLHHREAQSSKQPAPAINLCRHRRSTPALQGMKKKPENKTEERARTGRDRERKKIKKEEENKAEAHREQPKHRLSLPSLQATARLIATNLPSLHQDPILDSTKLPTQQPCPRAQPTSPISPQGHRRRRRPKLCYCCTVPVPCPLLLCHEEKEKKEAAGWLGRKECRTEMERKNRKRTEDSEEAARKEEGEKEIEKLCKITNFCYLN